MTGLLVVTHGQLGREMVFAGPQECLEGVVVETGDGLPKAAAAIAKAFRRVDAGEGVIIFTDLLGGTPSNLSLTFLNRPSVEVISGVNLPMLLKAMSVRTARTFAETVDLACKSGRDGISAANVILGGGETKT